jgi:hypothetical protein
MKQQRASCKGESGEQHERELNKMSDILGDNAKPNGSATHFRQSVKPDSQWTQIPTKGQPGKGEVNINP